jgi:LysR family glycine cleavage system transcriptional activator
VLLARDVLAYDDLRSGRLVMPVEFSLRSGQGQSLRLPKRRREQPQCKPFEFVKQEVATLDWRQVHPAGGMGPHVQP